MLDIPVATIRNWEERYASIVPERSPGGHRLYSRDHVEQLRFIAAEVSRGLSAADAHRLLAERSAGGQPAMQDGPGARTRLLVLLAERDPVAADLAQFFLRTEGYDVHLALAVDEAEEQWVESRPQLAIVELMISGGRGVELCRRLKQHEAGAVLAISVLEARDEALAAGADAFLQKPLDPLELVSTVKDLLGASALVARRGQESRLVDERGSSGDEGLDRILGGGLPLNGINLIMGRPGSGKTILCQQFMFARATEERPAVYLSTVSEPFEKILRYAQTLSFFDRGAIGRSIFYEDLGPAVAGEGGLTAVTERIGALIKEHRPGIIAIDSFKALAAFADDARGFRRFLHDLAALLTAFPATSFWIGEYSEDESRTAPEFAVADGIISLATERVSERTLRLIEVTKLRGSDFRSGRHAYRLSTDGITVFPRLADPLRDGGLPAQRRPDLVRDRAAGHDARRGLRARELHAGGRAVGYRQDLDGTPLHLQRRRERRARRDREPAGEPDPTARGSPAASAGRWTTSAWPSCTGPPTTSTSTNGSTSCSTSSRPPAPSAS